jgi:hypothetical protein
MMGANCHGKDAHGHTTLTEEVLCKAPFRQNYNNPAVATAFLDVIVNMIYDSWKMHRKV